MSDPKPLPLYARVKQHLTDRIAHGEWRDGTRIPSEHELMDSIGASRMTIHRALREMSADGLLRRVQGVGTFVRHQQPRSALVEITDISDDIKSRGHVHHARLVTLEAVHADAALATSFSRRIGAKLFHSEIIHYENDVAIQLEDRIVTPLFAPEYLRQDFATRTTASYLASLDPPTDVEHIIHATGPTPRAQSLLDIEPSEHCLQLHRQTWTRAGPATLSILTHPGSRYSLGSRYNIASWKLKQAG